jgi:glutathione synthase/RimK-type ligase-like ATP-grasp enzyme
MTATWPSASDGSLFRPAGVVVIGHPPCRRVALFQEALRRLTLPPAQVVSYVDLLAGRVHLSGMVSRGTLVRIESPGKEFDVEQALLLAGADLAEAEGGECLSQRAARGLLFERGRILAPRQWYLGFCEALSRIEQQLADCPDHRLMNRPPEIEVMFDKGRCHDRLAGAGVPVPRSLGAVRSFEELAARMRQAGCPRVFVKLAHGSSASGVAAYQTDGRRHQATTTVEMVHVGGELRLYNSRRIRVYRELPEIAALIDALCRHRVHVEQWLPKAGLDGRTVDLRVVVIGGQARHTVVRLSRSPMTNLHLLNDRGDPATLRARMGPAAWDAACQTCERALVPFAGSLYAGIDLLVAPDYRRHAVLEVNAFGDLLLGITDRGEDTYTATLASWQAAHCPELAS